MRSLVVERLSAGEVAEVTELVEQATEVDGSAPIGEHVVRRLSGAGPHLLVREADGALAGYAQLEAVEPGKWSAELGVAPRSRRRGFGTALVRQLVELADGSLQVWAHGELPGAVTLATAFEFRQVRTLWQMRRSLAEPELGPVELAEGIRLRPFVVGADEAEFLRVNNAAFDWHPEQGGWGLEQLREREAEPWFDPEGFLVAEDASTHRLLGYHWTKVHGPAPRSGDILAESSAETAPERIGEVYVLGVDPAAQGRRLGAALTLAGLHHLRKRGLDDVLLYVEADNHPAVRVYQKLGFTRWHTDAAFTRP